ncbi:Magnesium transport protein CorA, transmembrane region [Madurella fahalii]|uniref:Magnesium transport protein CorA, transmembrane region n=1 Tax=Madurella fahalii TaxID=1157608 RepID=A0ABQ0GD76_9PEZI
MEELSEAPNLGRVLKFLSVEEDKEFAVDKILDPTGTSLTIVVRPRRNGDWADQRRLQGQEDWEELFQEIMPSPAKNEPPVKDEKLDVVSHPKPNPRSTLLLLYAPALLTWWRDNKAPPEKDLKMTVSVRPNGDQRQRLRNIPFTFALFQFIVRRMSIHSWINRLISRANVPAFERTVTEMPLYSGNGENRGPQKALIYNCRTSNEWPDDMALSVTHFPAQKLSFAILFGPSKAQQKSIITRLKRAGADTSHPMLLPGILAELERIRQMSHVDELIDGLEEQLSRIGQETVASWQQSSQTKAERNRQKTEAWLNTTFSKNILLATVALLNGMRRHLDEFPALANSAAARRHRYPRHCGLDSLEYRRWRPEIPLSLDSTVYDFAPHTHAPTDSEYLTGLETLTSEPDNIHDPEAKYQDALYHASMRMKDRLTSIIAEYDDKIRACTMEVDGIAMATQWSHGETNMEIATASGEDSSQMRSIALVTMVFLPGTFFASMFSMTFFNWNSDSGGDHPIVSSSIWIYFLVTVVFTLITLMLFWYFILSRQRNRRRSRQDASLV